MSAIPGFGGNGSDALPPPPPDTPDDNLFVDCVRANPIDALGQPFALTLAGAQFVWTLDRGNVSTGESQLPKRDEEIIE